MNDLGKKIKQDRKFLNLSQEELGKLINTTQDTISLWERNKSYPSLEDLISLCNVFNETPNELLGFIDLSKNINSKYKLTEEQIFLISEYNNLSSTDKQKIINFMTVCNSSSPKQ